MNIVVIQKKEVPEVSDLANSTLTVNLANVRHNYAYLCQQAAPAAVGAVLKADAYGLQVEQIAPVLEQAGCRWFFVADWQEAARLQPYIQHSQSRIVILGGVLTGADHLPVKNHVPILNGLADVKYFHQLAQQYKTKIPVIIHIDTGLHRLGLTAEEIGVLKENPNLLNGLDIQFWMTHCIEPDQKDPALALAQYESVQKLVKDLLAAPLTFSNSGIFSLDEKLKGQLIRAGESLYGVTAFTDHLPGLKPVLQWHAKIIKHGRAAAGSGFGYNAAYRTDYAMPYAVVGAGYADGLKPDHDKKLCFYINDIPCPVLGTIAMDLTIIDTSSVPENVRDQSMQVEILGKNQDLNKLSAHFKTCPHEILVDISRRAARTYQ